jgi:hypothetical protein
MICGMLPDTENLSVTLTGAYVRLEPLDHRHLDGLVSAAAADPSLYQWSPVPQGHPRHGGHLMDGCEIGC